jgi:hypothetical protein
MLSARDATGVTVGMKRIAAPMYPWRKLISDLLMVLEQMSLKTMAEEPSNRYYPIIPEHCTSHRRCKGQSKRLALSSLSLEPSTGIYRDTGGSFL